MWYLRFIPPPYQFSTAEELELSNAIDNGFGEVAYSGLVSHVSSAALNSIEIDGVTIELLPKNNTDEIYQADYVDTETLRRIRVSNTLLEHSRFGLILYNNKRALALESQRTSGIAFSQGIAIGTQSIREDARILTPTQTALESHLTYKGKYFSYIYKPVPETPEKRLNFNTGDVTVEVVFDGINSDLTIEFDNGLTYGVSSFNNTDGWFYYGRDVGVTGRGEILWWRDGYRERWLAPY